MSIAQFFHRTNSILVRGEFHESKTTMSPERQTRVHGDHQLSTYFHVPCFNVPIEFSRHTHALELSNGTKQLAKLFVGTFERQILDQQFLAATAIVTASSSCCLTFCRCSLSFTRSLRRSCRCRNSSLSHTKGPPVQIRADRAKCYLDSSLRTSIPRRDCQPPFLEVSSMPQLHVPVLRIQQNHNPCLKRLALCPFS